MNPESRLWQGHDAEYWRRCWHAGLVELCQSVPSTNDVVVRLAEAGAPHFSVVLAEEQTRGRGRGGSRWHAPAGSSLLFSVLFRVPGKTGAPGTAPVRVGLAVAEAIAAASGLDAALKWPNDVLIRGHGKVAGILCEGTFSHERGGHVIAGIGINVTQRREEFSRELHGRACSLASAGGAALDRGALLTAVLRELRALADRITDPLTIDELQRLRERDLLRGSAITCDAGNGQLTSGIARGIAENGALLVERAGSVVPLTAGTVRLADSHAYPGSR